MFPRFSSKNVFLPTLAAAVFCLALLQALQPYYFLIPDNLNQLFPVWVESGRHWLKGENPFVSQYLYGGNYPLYKDVTFLSCFHPLVILISFLGDTPFRYSMIDLFASFQILAATLSMALLLHTLNERRFIQLPRWQIMALSLSYGFSGYNLIVGSFWFFYLANQVALPLYFTAFLLKRRSRAVAVIALSGAHAFLSGVPSSYLFTVSLCILFVCLQSYWEKRFENVLRLFLGQFGTALLLSPILYFAMVGFFDSSRSRITPVIPNYLLDVPLGTLVSGWFFAGFGSVIGPHFSMAFMSTALTYGIFNAAASWWLFACVFAKKNSFSPSWNRAILACLFFTGLLVVRPAWLTTVLEQLPFFRSTRWPFREMLILGFWLHLFIAFRLQNITRKVSSLLLIPGVVLLTVTLALFQPKAYESHALDRSYILSGLAEKHWQKIKSAFPKDSLLVPVLPVDPVPSLKDTPFTLIGAYNYPALFEIKSSIGYSSTPLSAALHRKEKFPFSPGYILESDRADFLKDLPSPLLGQLLSTQPIRISLEGNDTYLRFLYKKPD